MNIEIAILKITKWRLILLLREVTMSLEWVSM